MSDEIEIWKDIEGFENIYQISNYGRIRSLSRLVKSGRGYRKVKEKILKEHVCDNGYCEHILRYNGKTRNILVHREVAKCFIDNPNNLLEINHIDENKQNNFYKNLEWCDRAYNENYGTKKIRTSAKQRLTHSRCKKILQVKNGIIINTFRSLHEAERCTGIKHNNISESLHNKRRSAGGYKWIESLDS